MAPNANVEDLAVPKEAVAEDQKGRSEEEDKYKLEPVWRNITVLASVHIGAIYGIYLIFTSAQLYSSLFAFWLYRYAAIGVTAGAHKLWAHRSYKAKWQLRLYLMILHTMCLQGPLITWARDHRVHHKHSETNADPHNAKRGLFFSHIGWLMVKKHPDVLEKGKTIDVSDLYADSIIVFQKKYYFPLVMIFWLAIPMSVPMYFWDETLSNAFFVCVMLRYTVMLHMTFLVNSVAHKYGNRPYNKYTGATDQALFGILASGEGWHNFHHAFPWDYRCSELGGYAFNTTHYYIELFAKIGWAYDLKTASPQLIRAVSRKRGDGSRIPPEVPPPKDHRNA